MSPASSARSYAPRAALSSSSRWPAAAARRRDPPSAQTLEVTLTDAGCTPAKLTAKSGPVTIHVSNGGTVEGLASSSSSRRAGSSSASARTSSPGSTAASRSTCSRATTRSRARTAIRRTTAGSSSAARPLPCRPPTRRHWLAADDRVQDATSRVSRPSSWLRRGSSSQRWRPGTWRRRRRSSAPTRYHYEAIEPVAESFGDLDPEIDARAGDVPAASWTGFHRIEQILWQKNTTAGTAGYAKKLLADVTTLDTKVKTLSYQAAAARQRRRRASERGRGLEDHRRGGPLLAHRPLRLRRPTSRAHRQAFILLAPVLEDQGEGALVKTIDQRFAAVTHGLARYRRSTPLGYAIYSALTPADRRTFAQEVDALAEPLSTIAAKVSG